MAVTVDNGTLTDYAVSTATRGSDEVQLVRPSVGKTRIAVTPTCSTSAYALIDQVGGLMTFTSAALLSGGSGTIVGAQITCRAANTVTPDLDLVLFEASPTVASVDNGIADLTDANREAALELPPIKFRTADYVTMSANTSCAGRCLDGQPAIDFVCSGSANLFGILVARSVFTLASTTDIVVALRILQD